MINESKPVKLTDSLVITKRFRSPNEFAAYIENKVSLTKISYMEAVIQYCNEVDIDIESVGPVVNQKLKEKIQAEAIQSNMMRSKGS